MERYQVSENFILREIGGENILVPVGDAGVLDNTMITLNESCVFLWKLFQTPSTLDEVVNKTKEHYSGDADVIEQEVAQFVKEYLEVGLLEESKEL